MKRILSILFVLALAIPAFAATKPQPTKTTTTTIKLYQKASAGRVYRIVSKDHWGHVVSSHKLTVLKQNRGLLLDGRKVQTSTGRTLRLK